MILKEIFGSCLDLLRQAIAYCKQVLALRRFRMKFVAKFKTNLSPVVPFDLAVLRRVGRYSYGMLNVVAYGNPQEALEIGEFVSIAPDVLFHLGGEHPLNLLSTFPFETFVLETSNGGIQNITKGPITIRDDVWIGTRALILSGVEIGQGAVIGAGSVIAKSIPPYAVAVGNPARVIKYRFAPEIIEILCKRLDYQRLTVDKTKQIQAELAAPLTRERLEDILAAMGC